MRFVCWLWRGHGFWKNVASYDELHVDILASMLRRHGDHELICIHDGTFSPRVESIVMPPEVAALPNYLPKLWAWSPEFGDLIKDRFVNIDLDVVITADLAPVLRAQSPLLIWNGAVGEPYNTSLFALEPGYGSEVWTEMTLPAVAQAAAQAQKWTGDQSWVAKILGHNEATFGEDTGVVRYRPTIHRTAPPEGLKATFLCGPYEPMSEAKVSEWIRKAYH